MKNQEKIEAIKSFINMINSIEYYPNEKDIRNITQYALYQCSENYLFAILQLENFFILDKFRSEIDNSASEEDVEIKKYNFEGFIYSSYFNLYFVAIETHIRHIASYYQSDENKIEERSLTRTFDNLTNQNKTALFTTLDKDNIAVFKFFCYLRNTMHNFGFHSENNPSQKLIIQDSNSQITTEKTELVLEPGKANNLEFKKNLLLIEQVFKLIMKLNKLIPSTDFIMHKLDKVGFND